MSGAKAASCHSLQNGHWKSLAMITQIVADASPAMRPRSARSVMLSCGIAGLPSVPFADADVVAEGAAPDVGDCDACAGRAAASECEQATTSRTMAIAASDRSRIEGIGRGRVRRRRQGTGTCGTCDRESYAMR